MQLVPIHTLILINTEKGTMNSLAPKTVNCRCGHSFTSDRYRSWCEKCCDAVYYDEKDKNKYRNQNIYVVGIILAVITFLTYIFIELIANPFLSA